MNQHDVVGKPIKRIDGIDKVTGIAKYATDITLDNMLHAKLFRSPHAHAKVTHIDTTAAEKLPGVKAVATILEVPKVLQYWYFLRTEKKEKQIYLRDNIVRFVGDPVLAVAADNEETVDKALSLINVTYEKLPDLQDPVAALEEGSLNIHSQGNVAMKAEKEFGDIQEGFNRADIIVENTYHTSKQKHVSLEPIGSCVAHYQANGSLTVYSSTQLPTGVVIILPLPLICR